ncbi:MAG: Type II secretion system protein [Candidatus Magasanikbacteria bacterium GW2011_GWA2_56_11]|uniref:Type II secretion system protein n=1 Tax=Candidatus Magasanikbacteria bacterium GW2011_GWA2_56_11 TaxID=1619044 RepID=A0A0G1YGY0_9BACT|nr:MAG: Type II secretion system protein [Candidatus Magasanikbacteria bacterium GW2011_GWA2_56_11]
MPPVSAKLKTGLRAEIHFELRKVPFIQKIFFVDHLRTMIHAGLSLVEALEVLAKETEQRYFRGVIQVIKNEVEKGRPLSDVLAEHRQVFPPIYVRMIAAGELAGKLEESLGQVVVQMRKTHELTSSIRGAMIYPAVILTAMGAVAVMMVTVVLPKLITLFDEFDASLPLATRILIALTNFFSNPVNLVLITVFFAAALALFIAGLRRSLPFKRLVHRLNLSLPIAGRVIKNINLARFSLTLSSLLKSTLPIIQATENAADTCGNQLYKEALRGACERLKSGEPLSEILRGHARLFPPIVTEMIMVGERTGEIDRLLAELADFYGQEVDKTMKNFSTIIEPVIIIVLGLGVAGIAVAVVMPMFTLIQNF